MLSIAVPASFISPGQCHSVQQATSAAASLARAAVYFGVNEIVIYEDFAGSESQGSTKKKQFDDGETLAKKQKVSWESQFAAQVLRYMVTPKYLRKSLFPKDDRQKLRYAGKLPPITPFFANSKGVTGLAVRREGAHKSQTEKKSKRERQRERTTPYVNIGQAELLQLSQDIQVGQLVSIDPKSKEIIEGETASFVVRLASSFAELYTNAPGADGYSYTAYIPCGSVYSSTDLSSDGKPAAQIAGQENALLLFGRFKDINRAVDADTQLQATASDLIDGYLFGFEKLRIEDAAMSAIPSLQRQPSSS